MSAGANEIGAAGPVKILILEFDMFGKPGGGQTAYSKLIRANPGNTYFYFSHGEAAGIMPRNVSAIPFRITYEADGVAAPDELGGLYHRYLSACQFAAAARRHLGPTTFDVVDAPDYNTDALFIRPAMAAHDITVDRVALALHGTISSALDGDWEPAAVPATLRRELAVLEDAQYRVADVRYALSETYGAQWRNATGLPFRPLDPLHITDDFRSSHAVPARRSEDRPSVYFIGRREKRKGPDLFVDLMWAVGEQYYDKACVIGQESTGFSGKGSAAPLRVMQHHRDITIHERPALSATDLDAIFRDRSIVLLPSRYDQFNLIALEALRRGCPVFVSRQAGAAHWIETRYPELADLVIDIGCDRSAATRIRAALRDYDGLRARIVAAIKAKPLRATAGDLALLYETQGEQDVLLQTQFRQLGEYFQRTLPPHRIWPEPVPTPPSPAGSPVTPVAPTEPEPTDGLYRQGRDQLTIIDRMKSSFARTGDVSIPTDPEEIDNAIAVLVDVLNSQRSGRVAVFDRLARLEHARGHHLTGALYDLRVMRWLGTDAFQRLDQVVETFRAEGFPIEADVTAAMYADPDTARERCADLLAEQYRRNRRIKPHKLQILDDRRGAAKPKVAVIVSLYNAHTKLPTLLANIAAQTMAQGRQIEVVLVDSGSPGREHDVFTAIADQFPMQLVYARSAARETIQSAWNRGILLSRADYLCFLGVDEGMHPECLEVLSKMLDTDRSVDWVMADSVITEVTADGVFSHDIMKYDRAGFCPTLVHMETCYLSWVGGLYRRSIHTRFGYYDERFRAAGDTEFKSRLLKHIGVAHVAKTYGVFNNYPEERVTQHPRAEIEDQRSWYLYRAEAGVDYLYERASNDELRAALRLCMGYRKSYCGHQSTDFDFAHGLAARLVRNEGARAQDVLALTEQLLHQVRRIELIDTSIPISARMRTVEQALQAARALELVAMDVLSLPTRPRFELFNDNRFEQHWWSWSG